MHASKRETRILEAVRLQNTCSVSELATRLSVSSETIRRDIRTLEDRGLVLKVHGGVVLPDRLAEPPFQSRMLEHKKAKQRIAALTAAQIGDGDSLMMDTGSTTVYVALALRDHRDLLAITNSLEIARMLSGHHRVYMAGGELRADDGATFGANAIAFIEQFHVQHAILSISSISGAGAFADTYLCERELSRTVMAHADRTIVVADCSKFRHKAAIRVCDAEEVDMLITDAPPPPALLRRLRDAGVEVLVAGD